MNDLEILIQELKNDPLLKGFELTKNNICNAVFYLDEIKNCKSCKGIFECKNKVSGIKPNFDGENITYTPCKYLVHKQNSLNVNSSFASNYLADASFKNFKTNTEARKKALEYGLQFIKSSVNKLPKGLYIYGNFGTGKTYFLSALANELAQEKISSIIIFMPDFSRYIKNSMNDNSLEEKVDLLKNTDVLMLDDLGGEMISSWLRDEIIAPIIQYRTVNNKPIFITSNLDYNGLREHFSATRDDLDSIKANRILERIKSITKRVGFIEK